MIGSKKEAYQGSQGSAENMNALLGEGSEFEGKLNFQGVVRVDGVIKGEITSKDKLIIGEKAKVEAEISVGTAIISGEVKGNITASQRLEIHAPAKVTGNINTPTLIIDEGVIFEGSCQMSQSRGGPEEKPLSVLSKPDKED